MRVLPILFGIFAGLSAFTFFYAKGVSYFSDDPQACQNCHIMREQFDAWNRSSHKAVATCNGCHTPKNAIGKYAVKGINGWNHSAAFTAGYFPEPIQIRVFSREIAVSNCIRCHQEIISRMLINTKGEKSDCFACHGNVGHQERE